MLRCIGNILALLALVFITGLHMVVLQGTASVRMVVDYSRASTVRDGLSKTMDGAHPCAMCLKIRKTQSEEKKTAATIGYSEKKSEAILLTGQACIPVPLLSAMDFADASETSVRRAESPALRPPRAA